MKKKTKRNIILGSVLGLGLLILAKPSGETILTSGGGFLGGGGGSSGDGGFFDNAKDAIADALGVLPNSDKVTGEDQDFNRSYSSEDTQPSVSETSNKGMGALFQKMPEQYSEAGFYQDVLGRAGGIAGRQLLAEAMIGKHIVKPLPFAKTARRAGIAARSGLASATKTITPVATKLTAKAAAKPVGRVALRTAPKVAGRVAGRLVPGVGWGMMFADVGADVARLGGRDVTEWMGFSSLAEPFLGYNPLERWVSETGYTSQERREERKTSRQERREDRREDRQARRELRRSR